MARLKLGDLDPPDYTQPPPVKILLSAILSVVFLVSASPSYASNPAPGVQILVKQGRTTVFAGTTDGTGKFYTAPLEPGIYLFEVRGPKAVGPTRYFLALAGARPAGETLTNADGDLAMPAEVTRPRGVTGQVRARRTLRLPPVGAPGEGTASQSSGVVSPIDPVIAGSTAYRAPSSQRAAIIAPAPASNRATLAPAATAPQRLDAGNISMASSPVPRPLMIGGKRYIWVPTTSGSNLGRWVLDRRQPAAQQRSSGR